MSYLISTFAPASSNAFFKDSASSFETPSFNVFGAASTNSFASLRPRLQRSFTNLTTFSLEAPASAKTTSNAVFSSTAAPAAAGPAATATAAAAGSIPYSSFSISANSFTSFTVRLTNCSANAFKSAILFTI